VDIQNFLDENNVVDTSTVVPVESHVNSLFGIEGETVSQEGFGDILKRFWNWVTEEGKPGVGTMAGGWFKQRQVIIQTLQKTYLNQEWLSKRVVRTGMQLRLDPSYQAIGVNGVIPTQDLDAPIADFLDKLTKVSEAYSSYLRHLDLELKRLLHKINTFDVDALNIFEVEDLREALDASRLRLTVDYRTVFGNTHVQRILTPIVDTDKPFNTAKLSAPTRDALSVEEIIACANGIIKVSEALDIMTGMRKDFSNLKSFDTIASFARELDNYITTASSPEHASKGIDTDAHERMLSLITPIYEIPNRMLQFHLYHVDSIIRAYARLIDASVK
jgi:hypothetical protein